MVLVTQWSSGHFNTNTDRAVCKVFKNSEEMHFHNSEEKFKHYARKLEKLIKILIAVKTPLLIRFSEFPINMHNFRPI